MKLTPEAPQAEEQKSNVEQLRPMGGQSSELHMPENVAMQAEKPNSWCYHYCIAIRVDGVTFTGAGASELKFPLSTIERYQAFAETIRRSWLQQAIGERTIKPNSLVTFFAITSLTLLNLPIANTEVPKQV